MDVVEATTIAPTPKSTKSEDCFCSELKPVSWSIASSPCDQELPVSSDPVSSPPCLWSASISAQKDYCRFLEGLPQFDASCPLGGDGDVVLVFDDGSNLHCHRVVLSKWSSVLKELFETKRTSSAIKMPGSSCGAWTLLLCMMYPVELNLLALGQVFLREIIVEADRYGVPLAKKRVESCMVDAITLNSKTAIKWAEFACDHDLDTLLPRCVPHILSMLIEGEDPENLKIQRDLHCLSKECLLMLLLSMSQECKRLCSSDKKYAGDNTAIRRTLREIQQRYNATLVAIENAGCFVSWKGSSSTRR